MSPNRPSKTGQYVYIYLLNLKLTCVHQSQRMNTFQPINNLK